jgi:hypothetical protein
MGVHRHLPLNVERYGCDDPAQLGLVVSFFLRATSSSDSIEPLDGALLCANAMILLICTGITTSSSSADLAGPPPHLAYGS